MKYMSGKPWHIMKYSSGKQNENTDPVRNTDWLEANSIAETDIKITINRWYIVPAYIFITFKTQQF